MALVLKPANVARVSVIIVEFDTNRLTRIQLLSDLPARLKINAISCNYPPFAQMI